jgi:hypothetical protein
VTPQGRVVTGAQSRGRPKHLTCDSHHDHVRPSLMTRVYANDDSPSFLRGRLIGEREWDENDVADAIGGRIGHRPSCPKRRGRLPRTDARRPA